MADKRGFKMPSTEEILAMIDSSQDITEEEKQAMKEQILGKMAGKGTAAEESAAFGSATSEIILVFFLFIIVAAVIGGIAVKLILREWAREAGKKKKSSEKTIAIKKRAKKSK